MGFGISKVGHKILPDYHYYFEYCRFGNPSADLTERGSVPNLLYHWRHLSRRMYGCLSKLQLACLRIIRWRAVAGLCLDLLLCGQSASVHHNECL